MTVADVVETERVEARNFYELWSQVNCWVGGAIDLVICEGVHESRIEVEIGIFDAIVLSVDKYSVCSIRMRQRTATISWTKAWRHRVRVMDAFRRACRDLDKITYDVYGFSRLAHYIGGDLPAVDADVNRDPVFVRKHPTSRKDLVIIHAYGIDTVPDL